jgi:hypothetical protein
LGLQVWYCLITFGSMMYVMNLGFNAVFVYLFEYQ